MELGELVPSVSQFILKALDPLRLRFVSLSKFVSLSAQGLKNGCLNVLAMSDRGSRSRCA